MTIVDEIKSVARVSEVAARYTEVKRRGRLSVCRCLCGENSDRNPSFTLYEDDNHYHCFACGRHGSVIDLVMLVEGLDFRAAVERLRREFLLNLPYGDAPRRIVHPIAPPVDTQGYEHVRADVLSAMNAATQHYHTALLRTPLALAYLHRRGLHDDTIRRLRLGYADGDLGRALFTQQHAPGLLARIGLLMPAGEMLRNRIVFPVLDGEQKHTLFMIGRALHDEQEPKYLGLPDGLVHKQPMRCGHPQRGVIVVEGPIDYAALVQWGCDAAFRLIALLGTAHAKTVSQLAAIDANCRILVALDQDKAGQGAALRLMSTLVERGLCAATLTWRDAKDCGELLQQGEYGRIVFERALAEAGA